MSAHIAFLAPIGATLSWSNGRPRPTESELEALIEWKQQNGSGRLALKTCRTVMGQALAPRSFKVLLDDDADEPVFRIFAIDCDLTFEIIDRPGAGACRVFSHAGHDAELVHLSKSRTHAEAWVNNLGLRAMALEDVTADEIAADVVEGRAAA